MMNRKDMIDEANLLGLEFKGNISNKKLAELIADFKGEDDPIDISEAPPASPAMKQEDADQEVVESAAEIARKRIQEKYNAQRKNIATAKEKALAKQVVTITNRDARESSIATTVYLSCQNQFFGIARVVPLDIPVELEHCLIQQAETAQMTQHTDEVVDNRRTGNKIARRVKKYSVSYSPVQPD